MATFAFPQTHTHLHTETQNWEEDFSDDVPTVITGSAVVEEQSDKQHWKQQTSSYLCSNKKKLREEARKQFNLVSKEQIIDRKWIK